jgi:Arc/MetJ-type ribon-helix-helix transcriptional regulator
MQYYYCGTGGACLSKDHITARLEPEENAALDQAVERKIAKNRGDAIRQAVRGFAKRHKIPLVPA